MLAVNCTTMRGKFKNYCDKVADENETVIITRRNKRNVVVISLEQYNYLTKDSRKIFSESDKVNKS